MGAGTGGSSWPRPGHGWLSRLRGDAKVAVLAPDGRAPVPVEKDRPAGRSGVGRWLPADPLLEHVLVEAISQRRRMASHAPATRTIRASVTWPPTDGRTAFWDSNASVWSEPTTIGRWTIGPSHLRPGVRGLSVDCDTQGEPRRRAPARFMTSLGLFSPRRPARRWACTCTSSPPGPGRA